MSPAWFWLVIFIEVNVTWISYDVWAKLNHHNTLSRQMHDWMFNPAIAPFLFGGLAGVVVLLVLHFLIYHGGRA